MSTLAFQDGYIIVNIALYVCIDRIELYESILKESLTFQIKVLPLGWRRYYKKNGLRQIINFFIFLTHNCRHQNVAAGENTQFKMPSLEEPNFPQHSKVTARHQA